MEIGKLEVILCIMALLNFAAAVGLYKRDIADFPMAANIISGFGCIAAAVL
jgi:hypothetical protein